MSCSPETAVKIDDVVISPGSGHDSEHSHLRSNSNHGLRRAAGTCRRDNHYRRLAICSIICGLSCIGVVALKYSVKAKETHNREQSAMFAKKAKKFSIISIVTFFSILAAIPVLMALISYLATFKD